MKRPYITYFNMGAMPIYVGFTTSPAAFRKEMRRMGIKSPPVFVGEKPACVHHFYSKAGENCAIVCLNLKKFEGRSITEIHGVLVHEAVHVWQSLREDIGERSPGSEMEAYTVQWIAQNLFCAYEEVV